MQNVHDDLEKISGKVLTHKIDANDHDSKNNEDDEHEGENGDKEKAAPHKIDLTTEERQRIDNFESVMGGVSSISFITLF
jgi:hypothetical protein